MWKSILSPKELSSTTATIIIALVGVAFGFMPLFVKTLTNAGLASPAIVFYRYLLTTLLLSPTLMVTGEKRRQAFLAIGGGIAAGFGWIAYVDALKSIPVATVGVIFMTYPLFTLLISMLWLRKIPSFKAILGGVLIVVAAFITLSPASIGETSLKSILASFFAPLTFGYVVVVLSDKLPLLTPLQRAAGYASGATLGLLPLMLSLESSAIIPSRLTDWMIIFGLSTVGYLLPQVAYVIAAPFIGSARAAVAESTQLPMMFVVGWLGFGEQITLLECLAALLILIAISITPADPSETFSEEVEDRLLLPPNNKNSE